MKFKWRKAAFQFEEWKVIRERGFVRYVYMWNLLLIAGVFIGSFFFGMRSWLEIITVIIVNLVIINLSLYFEWWDNEETFNKELNKDQE